MKKIFTLLTMALLAIGANAQTAKDAYLDITQYATLTDESINIKNATTVYSWDDKNKVLVVSAYAVQQSAQKNQDEGVTGYGWMTYTGSNSTGTSWEATGVFNGSAFYGTLSGGSASDRGIVAGKNNNVFSFYVTNCIQVSALVNSKGTSRTITMDIYPVTFDGTTPTRGDKAGTVSDKSGALKTITVDNLDASKIYEIAISGDNTSGSHLYELAFYGKGAAAQEAVDVVFTLSKSEIYVDETAQLLVNDKSWPEDLAFPTSGWDTELISISETGLITPNKAGTATIQFTTAAVEGKYKEGTANLSLTISERPTPETISYPESKNGIMVGGTCEYSKVKIHKNTDAVDCIKLNNGYTTDSELNANYVTIKVQGGFKYGDVIKITGIYNNKEEKKAGVAILARDANETHGYKKLWESESFINGQTSEDDPAEQSFTLSDNYDELLIGRTGSTAANIIKITTEHATPLEPHEREAINLAGELREADVAALEASEDWTKNEDGSYGYKAVESEVAKAGFEIEGVSLFSGLKFGRNGSIDANKITLIPGKGISLAGSQYRIILTGLAKDDELSLRITGNGDGDRSVTLSNATKKEAAAPARRAEEAAAKLTSSDNETVEGTFVVSSDGSVIIETDGGLTVNAIAINTTLPEYTPTGISVINAETKGAADAPVYNLSGQRVDENYRGVVIKNGKKMIK